jgi:hypothetical protein
MKIKIGSDNPRIVNSPGSAIGAGSRGFTTSINDRLRGRKMDDPMGARADEWDRDAGRVVPGEIFRTFEWHGLYLHLVTPEPLSSEQVRQLEKAFPMVTSVGMFSEMVSTLLGRAVHIRTTRPSPDIRLEVR